MPYQMFIAGIISLLGMCSMFLITMICNQERISINGFWDDYMFGCIFIVLWFNNINILLLVVFHYLRILTTLIYNLIFVFIESALYLLICHLLLYTSQLYIWYIAIIAAILISAICTGWKILRMLTTSRFKSKYQQLSIDSYNNQAYLLGKRTDIVICISLPLVPIIIILLNLLAGL